MAAILFRVSLNQLGVTSLPEAPKGRSDFFEGMKFTGFCLEAMPCQKMLIQFCISTRNGAMTLVLCTWLPRFRATQICEVLSRCNRSEQCYDNQLHQCLGLKQLEDNES